jgi:predicted nucleotidyltransferase
MLRPERVWLFGSRAKGRAHRGSDFDFGVESRRPPFQIQQQLQDQIDEIAGLHHVDLIYLPEVDPEFQELVRKTGKVVFNGRTDPGARKAA